MVYDVIQEKGVKRKNIPSPKMISFPKATTYAELIKQRKETFFPSGPPDLSSCCLVGAAGVPFDINNEDE